jgi:hypothetical protein
MPKLATVQDRPACLGRRAARRPQRRFAERSCATPTTNSSVTRTRRWGGYSSNGAPVAKARDGSRITFTGQGGWDPATRRATGTGSYVIRNAAGAVRTRGTWTATRFIDFRQLAGWWGIANFKEEGWQGPPGSASFSGVLRLRVTLTGRGGGVLRLWRLMSEVPKPKGHVGDGLSFIGRSLRFTDFRAQERGTEGVMFYSR